MKIMGQLLVYICVSFLLVGCEHKEFCYQHPHNTKIRLVFDWRNAPEANPEGMCVYFYPINGRVGSWKRFDFQGSDGGEFDISVGRYRVLCYNNDTEAVTFGELNDFYTHLAFCREGHLFESLYGNGASVSTQPRSVEDEPVVICPDMFWGCSVAEIEITEKDIIYENPMNNQGRTAEAKERILTLFPHELVCTYTYEIRNVTGLARVTQMSASISGMSPSLLLGEEELGRTCVTLPLEAHSDKVSTITGKFYTFGHHEENMEPHRMYLYVWLDDGSKYYYGSSHEQFDVTTQVHEAPDKRHVHIIIDGLDLPEPITGEDGFDASTDDWIEIEQEIEM